MAKAKLIPGLGEEDAFAAAAARIVAVRTRELADEAHDVLDVGDIERVHDMRVATRRLRAALEVFAPCFPKKRFRAALKEVKALADALGERRDRDVTIAALSEFEAGIAGPDRPGIRRLGGRLRHEQAKANEGLAPYVTRSRITGLCERLDELVAEADGLVGGREADAESDAQAEPEPPSPAPAAEPAGTPALTNGGEPR